MYAPDGLFRPGPIIFSIIYTDLLMIPGSGRNFCLVALLGRAWPIQRHGNFKNNPFSSEGELSQDWQIYPYFPFFFTCPETFPGGGVFIAFCAAGGGTERIKKACGVF